MDNDDGTRPTFLSSDKLILKQYNISRPIVLPTWPYYLAGLGLAELTAFLFLQSKNQWGLEWQVLQLNLEEILELSLFEIFFKVYCLNFFFFLIVVSRLIVEVFSALIEDNVIFMFEKSLIRLSKITLNFVVKVLTLWALFKCIVSGLCITMLLESTHWCSNYELNL